jgi:hypothetical protein
MAGHQEALKRTDSEAASKILHLVDLIIMATMGDKACAPCRDSSCRHVNEPNAKFCSHCGRPLADEPG